jgi:hypothetical protein
MKTSKLLFLTLAILLTAGWSASVRAQEIPINYHQNANIEHEFSTLFWSGYDDTYYGIYSHPQDYKTDEFAHSGKYSLEIWVQPGGQWGTWIWVSYPIRGHEQKKMKASFWYKGYVTTYWNFIYRDAGMTFQDLPIELAEYVGADNAYWGGEGQDAIAFDFGGDSDYTEDWTYFEFVWDFPGTLPGWGNTAMWYAYRDSAYVDDIYYGEWYDGQYSGEEPFGFLNGDFEKNDLGAEWLVNVSPGGTIAAVDFLTDLENNTEAGAQSLRLMDYMEVFIDTLDDVAPYDSIDIDTTTQDRNVTYYLPAIGAEGEDMEMSFWYKGNEATMDLFVYDDYQITTEELPVPDDAQLLALDPWDDTTGMEIDSTLVWDYSNPISSDTAHLLTLLLPEVVGSENFDNVTGTPALFDWNWSGYNYFGYIDWPGQITGASCFSPPKSLWLPGDVGWSGAVGTLPGIVDGGAYSFSFKYKGKLQLYLMFGRSLKYDLVGDPDGIIPPEATVGTDDKDGTKYLLWSLNSEEWIDFSYILEVGTWLADSGVTSPAGLEFDLVGTYDYADVGYVDDIKFGEVVVPVDILAKQNFDGLDGAKPEPMDWNWSDAGFFGSNDWDGEMVEDESYSAPTSFWIPTDPAWTGAEGIISGIEDSAAYSIKFMYKGNLKLSLDLGADLKYDLAGDPEGIIPPEATVDGRSLLWELTAENGWKKFSYAWEQGSWLEDSAVASPANMTFMLWDSELGDGWVDNLLITKSREKIGAVSLVESSMEITTVYGIDTVLYDTTYTIEQKFNQVLVGGDSDLDPLAIHWNLPDAADWTEWKFNWTNPTGDIGGNLTMFLDNTLPASPFHLTPEVTTLDPEHAGWTFFDDFNYGIVSGINPRRNNYPDLHVYPNPADDVLYLSLENPLSRINVYNSLGQLVKSLNHPDRKFNVSDLASGIYLLNVTDQRGTVYKTRFIKE